MEKVGKFLLCLSVVLFTSLAISFLLFREVEGVILNSESLLYSSGTISGKYVSSPTRVSLLRYSYKVGKETFKSATLRFYGGYRDVYRFNTKNQEIVRVFYFKKFPQISIVDRATGFLTAGMLLLFGFGLIETSKWLRNLRSR